MLRPEPLNARDVTLEVTLERAIRSANRAEANGIPHDRTIPSAKSPESVTWWTLTAMLAPRTHYPLHLGLTEAGSGDKGIISSTAAPAILLHEGIGDTIRTRPTPSRGAAEREVHVAQQVLQSLDRRPCLPQVRPAQGDGGTTSTSLRRWPRDPDRSHEADARLARAAQGLRGLRVAVMGCVVNGPGETNTRTSDHPPRDFEDPVAPVSIDGRLDRTLRGDGLVAEFIVILEDYVDRR